MKKLFTLMALAGLATFSACTEDNVFLITDNVENEWPDIEIFFL